MNAAVAYSIGEVFGGLCCAVSLSRNGLAGGLDREQEELLASAEGYMANAFDAGFEAEWRAGQEYGAAHAMYKAGVLEEIENEVDVLPETVSSFWLAITRGRIKKTQLKKSKRAKIVQAVKDMAKRARK